ncbi:Lrp/AsnC family transcriptional regulator [Aureimonas mangrovi]|jgi:DNA-binding Lrp family transcriptional regulator|uniref:Lrp/AsnC family transcriptional regulator n=1 Tax=Aureimonas mangrovi TaxID=2758041 RepID=UPI00163DBABD|nr:Lrp/AsnC family transcriptional regulator [Aureimonas mangrovi]
MDATDLRILRALQEDPEGSVEAIGRAAGISHTPCWRRIRQMQEAGVLKGRRYVIDEKAVGLTVTVITMVKLSKHDQKSLDAFESEAARLHEIVECYLVTGQYDFALTIVTRDMESFEMMLKTKLSNLPHVADMNSTVVLRKAKTGGRLPI